MTVSIDRRTFVKGSAAAGGGLVAAGPLAAFAARSAHAQGRARSAGYGPLVLKGDLWLPPEFNYQVVSRQGTPMNDGNPTPGIFDGMAAYRGRRGTTILIRNHENRERAGEIPVIVPADKAYDYPSTIGGNTKLVVSRERAGRNPDGTRRYVYTVEEQFAILGGTSTNCAGGVAYDHYWITCEEVVKGESGGSDGMTAAKDHGYIFFIDAYADGPVEAIPVREAGRFSHEAALEWRGIVYETEDRSITPDPVLGEIGACLYRYLPDGYGRGDDDDDRRRRGDSDSGGNGRLEALKIRGEWHANMDKERQIGRPYPVEWVPVPDPDHDDDTDNRRDRAEGFIPTRIQAQDRGAAYFDRQEGMWTDERTGIIYFDCTSGGVASEGQVWAYDPRRERLTLIFESQRPEEDEPNDAPGEAFLNNPDNIVIVPHTGHLFLQEDSEGTAQFVRGLTKSGRIYDFARTAGNTTEFCGGCFSPDGSTFFVNQQGERGGLPDGPPDGQAVTYAIYGPFDRIRDDDDDDDDRRGRGRDDD